MDAMEIVTRNRDLQKQARELNVRAGEKIFPVMSQEEIERWLKERLGGARRMAEVKNLAVIAFPELEQGMVDLVMSENPDEIIVLGKTLKVEYRDGYAPRVTLDRETIAAHDWRELPDAGIKLPGGRLVEVVVPFSYYDKVSDQNIPELKSSCVNKANKSLWDNWPTEGRPVIALPNPADPMSTVPEIIECRYGISVVDGATLVAFGAVALKDYSYPSNPWFNGKWFQVREEANAARAKSAAKLESIREEVIKQKQMDDASEAAKTARKSLQSVQSRQGWYDLDIVLRTRVENRFYAYPPPSDLKNLHQTWMQATNALIAEVEAAFKAKAKPASAEQVKTSLAALQAKFGKKR